MTTKNELSLTEMGRQQEELTWDLFGLGGTDQELTIVDVLHLRGFLDTQMEMKRSGN